MHDSGLISFVFEKGKLRAQSAQLGQKEGSDWQATYFGPIKLSAEEEKMIGALYDRIEKEHTR